MFIFYNSYFIRCSTNTCFILVQFIKYVICIMWLRTYIQIYIYISKCKPYMYMHVNKHVELAQRGIALQKIYILVFVHFSSRWYLRARKNLYACQPVSKKFSQRCLWNSSNVVVFLIALSSPFKDDRLALPVFRPPLLLLVVSYVRECLRVSACCASFPLRNFGS